MKRLVLILAIAFGAVWAIPAVAAEDVAAIQENVGRHIKELVVEDGKIKIQSGKFLSPDGDYGKKEFFISVGDKLVAPNDEASETLTVKRQSDEGVVFDYKSWHLSPVTGKSSVREAEITIPWKDLDVHEE